MLIDFWTIFGPKLRLFLIDFIDKTKEKLGPMGPPLGPQ